MTSPDAKSRIKSLRRGEECLDLDFLLAPTLCTTRCVQLSQAVADNPPQHSSSLSSPSVARLSRLHSDLVLAAKRASAADSVGEYCCDHFFSSSEDVVIVVAVFLLLLCRSRSDIHKFLPLWPLVSSFAFSLALSPFFIKVGTVMAAEAPYSYSSPLSVLGVQLLLFSRYLNADVAGEP